MDYVKRPLAKSLNDLALKRARSAIEVAGRALPCHVVSVISSGIVEVAFDVDADPFTLPQVIVPVQAPEWVRYPIQIGDRGLCQPADVRLGGASGLGDGTPTLTRPGNLGALSFVFLGNSGWSDTDNPNAVVLYGPDGAILRTQDGTHKIAVDGDGANVDGALKTAGATQMGFYGHAPAVKPPVAGIKSAITDANAKIVITAIIDALKSIGLVTDLTT